MNWKLALFLVELLAAAAFGQVQVISIRAPEPTPAPIFDDCKCGLDCRCEPPCKCEEKQKPLVSVLKEEFKPDIAPRPKKVTVEEQLLAAHNKERESRGLHPYRLNKTLEKVAQDCASYAARVGSFTHFPNGRTVEQRVRAAGYSFSAVGENGAGDVQDPTWAWLFHPGGHRDAVLHPVYTEAGFARKGGFWCAVYAKPAEVTEKPFLTTVEAAVAADRVAATFEASEKKRAELDRVERELSLLKNAGKSKDPNVVVVPGKGTWRWHQSCVNGLCKERWNWYPATPQREPYKVPMRQNRVGLFR